MSLEQTIEPPRPGSPATRGPTSGEPPLVERRLVFAWFAGAVFWLLVAPVFGLIAAMKLDDPHFLPDLEWLQFGRLRVMHVLGVIFGAFSHAMFGFLYYAVPRLCARPIVAPRAAWAGFWIFTLAVLAGEVAISIGELQPVEAGEYPMLVDVFITIAFVILTGTILATIAMRREKRLYVSLWYWIAALLWTCINFPLGAFILPHFVTGASSAAMHGFYLHNVVGLWITPIGVGAAYYLLPVAANARLWSHGLSLIGFWALAFFYPLNGVHHYIYSPIADWAQTIAIVSSMMLILPVVAFTANLWGTMMGHWRKFSGDNWALKFTIVGAVWYLITCIQGPTQALRAVQAWTHFGDYNVGHAHSAVFGTFIFWSMAAAYFVIPRLTGRELWSSRLGAWHFWLEVLGFALMFTALTISGFAQGAMLLDANSLFVDSIVRIKPHWLARTVGGTLMDVGIALFAFNIAMTVVAGRRTRAPGRD